MSTLYRRPNSPYFWGRITAPGGKTVRHSSGTTDRKAAEAWLIKETHDLWQEARLGIKPTYLWNEAVVKWCQEKADEKKTVDEDVSKFAWLHSYLNEIALANITQQKIDEIGKLKANEASPSTANRYLALIRAV